MKDCNIAFIGCGNMAKSIIGGLLASGADPKSITAADPDAKQCQLVSTTLGIHCYADNKTIVADADIIVLAVKPQIMAKVVQDIAGAINNRSILIISIAAGVRLSLISKWLGYNVAIIRVMSNIPALIQWGATALFANNTTTAKQKEFAENMMRSIGNTLWLVNEDQMDTVTALSGSGPAYFFYLMEAMEKAGKSLGLSELQARQLISQTAIGAAKLVLSTHADPETLRQQVTSKGGTTEQALNVLIKGKFDNLISEAITAARNRALEIAKKLDK